MHDAVDGRERDVRLAGDAFHTFADRDTRVRRCGELLAGEDEIARFVDQHEVGEGAAYVDANPATGS